MEHVLAVHELPDPLRGVVLVAELFHTYHALAVVILLLERGTVVPYGVRLNTIHAGDAYRGQFDAGGGIAVSRIFGGKGANFAAGGGANCAGFRPRKAPQPPLVPRQVIKEQREAGAIDEVIFVEENRRMPKPD
eukprot:CAMPEP_0197572624 /NCGR_PEP_ID=MMETSP1320-20131121/42554_1 /TAXON_ID=91990 /ORGANISM="Bolidomonas sp., Strain RCC2347" /LENGTH=133 /DNA_ID=CAMNT_0043135129 /DNA_START=132 /DNA_END=533 /DNA_ORIENTATION=+